MYVHPGTTCILQPYFRGYTTFTCCTYFYYFSVQIFARPDEFLVCSRATSIHEDDPLSKYDESKMHTHTREDSRIQLTICESKMGTTQEDIDIHS